MQNSKELNFKKQTKWRWNFRMNSLCEFSVNNGLVQEDPEMLSRQDLKLFQKFLTPKFDQKSFTASREIISCQFF